MKNPFDTARGTIVLGIALTVALWSLARWLVSLA
jgi:hypothetical protein